MLCSVANESMTPSSHYLPITLNCLATGNDHPIYPSTPVGPYK